MLSKLGRKPLQSEAPPIRSAAGGPMFVVLSRPLSSTSWDGDSKTTGDNGIIDLSAVFGAPAGLKAVHVRLCIQDGTVGVIARVGRDASWLYCVTQRTQVADQMIDVNGIVPCDENGDVYFSCTGDLDNVEIYINAYWK